MSKLEILYEDEHLISVIKPYGVLSQGNEKTHSICDEISEYLKAKGENGKVYVVHRLDKTTGGVMIFAKTQQAASKMSALVSQHKLQKRYIAVLCGKLEEKESLLCDLLYHDKQKNKTYVVKRERKGVKEAKLCYEVLNTKKFDDADVSIVKVELITGRTHQIRVQFANRKHSLIGDRKYGSAVHSDNIALWSYEIEFEHPITTQRILLNAKPQGDVFS